MKNLKIKWIVVLGIVGGCLFFLATSASAQTAPVLAIAPAATNQISITITNAILTDSYEVWWTPVIDDTGGHPWSAAAVGGIGQSNFIVNMNGLGQSYYYGLLDTNTPPLWENANPSNPSTNILKITIASPANGSTLN